MDEALFNDPASPQCVADREDTAEFYITMPTKDAISAQTSTLKVGLSVLMKSVKKGAFKDAKAALKAAGKLTYNVSDYVTRNLISGTVEAAQGGAKSAGSFVKSTAVSISTDPRTYGLALAGWVSVWAAKYGAAAAREIANDVSDAMADFNDDTVTSLIFSRNEAEEEWSPMRYIANAARYVMSVLMGAAVFSISAIKNILWPIMKSFGAAANALWGWLKLLVWIKPSQMVSALQESWNTPMFSDLSKRSRSFRVLLVSLSIVFETYRYYKMGMSAAVIVGLAAPATVAVAPVAIAAGAATLLTAGTCSWICMTLLHYADTKLCKTDCYETRRLRYPEETPKSSVDTCDAECAERPMVGSDYAGNFDARKSIFTAAAKKLMSIVPTGVSAGVIYIGACYTISKDKQPNAETAKVNVIRIYDAKSRTDWTVNRRASEIAAVPALSDIPVTRAAVTA